MRIVVNICRLVVALTLIFSGFVKAIDPLGTQYKIDDYLGALGLLSYVPQWVTLSTSIALSALEFLLGMLLLFAIHRRLVSRLIVTFLGVMTLVTLWIWIADPVKDCGCFGDAIKITNGETLLKNIVLLACSIVVAWKPLKMTRFISHSNQWIVKNYTLLFILVVSTWCLYDLPLFDFRPYHIGVNIEQDMQIPEGAPQPEYETTFVLEKDGVQKEFSIDNYPDSTWKFVDSHSVLVKEGYEPPIHDFSIQTLEGEDVTDSILHKEGYTFLLVAPMLGDAEKKDFGDINILAEYANEKNYGFCCLTASSTKDIEKWRQETGADYPIYHTDGTTLKTIIRSNPGLLLLKDGTIIQKWSDKMMPEIPMVDGNTPPLEEQQIGQMADDSTAEKIALIVILFIVPMFVLTIADRLFAWTKWFRKDEDTNNVKHLNNKVTMRKKIVAGNWKMNMNLQDGIALAKELNDTLTADSSTSQVWHSSSTRTSSVWELRTAQTRKRALSPVR